MMLSTSICLSMSFLYNICSFFYTFQTSSKLALPQGRELTSGRRRNISKAQSYEFFWRTGRPACLLKYKERENVLKTYQETVNVSTFSKT